MAKRALSGIYQIDVELREFPQIIKLRSSIRLQLANFSDVLAKNLRFLLLPILILKSIKIAQINCRKSIVSTCTYKINNYFF